MNLFVSNISRNANEASLRELFEGFGEVSSAKIIMDKFTRESKGFGFVEMSSEAEAKEAMKELSNTEFHGRNLVVAEARPKTENRNYNTSGGNSYNNKY